jgi:hypothetical protein
MQLSQETITILKNFGSINQCIFFRQGNVLNTISAYKSILAQAEIKEEIPLDFGIYDLNNLLTVLSIHKDVPTLEFDNKHVVIIGNGGRSKIKYRFCDPNMITLPPEKPIQMPEPEISFNLTADDFLWILKASSVLSSPQIAVESDGRKVYLVTLDIQNDAAHTEALEIKDGNGSEYRMVFKTENLVKILAGDYGVDISSKGISHFTNTVIPLQYWVSVETGSYFK